MDAKREKALAALLSEATIKDAAKRAGVSEVSLWRRLQEPEFQSAYRDARGRLLESTLTALQAASVEAVCTLKEVMSDKMAQPSARVSAARTVLDAALRAREVLEIEERLRMLEQALTPTAWRKAE